jgi:hypothetical protein
MPEVWPDSRLIAERAAIVRDMEALALTLEPRVRVSNETNILVINGRRVTVQRPRQSFTVSVGKQG